MITPLPYWNFNPVLPTAFDDSLSYLEMVSKLYKKLEEVIAEVNAIDQEAIQQALDDMRAEIAKFEGQIQKQYNALDEKYQKLLVDDWVHNFYHQILTVSSQLLLGLGLFHYWLNGDI